MPDLKGFAKAAFRNLKNRDNLPYASGAKRARKRQRGSGRVDYGKMIKGAVSGAASDVKRAIKR